MIFLTEVFLASRYCGIDTIIGSDSREMTLTYFIKIWVGVKNMKFAHVFYWRMWIASWLWRNQRNHFMFQRVFYFLILFVEISQETWEDWIQKIQKVWFSPMFISSKFCENEPSVMLFFCLSIVYNGTQWLHPLH